MRYIKFCHQFKFTPVPINEEVVQSYIAFLDMSNISVRSIRVYLASIRALHVDQGFPDPDIYTPKVKLMLRALDRYAKPVRRVLPITYDILKRAFGLFNDNLEHNMLWAAMTTAFFGCLRAAELCPVSDCNLAPKMADLSFHSSQSSLYFKLLIRNSKTSLSGFIPVVACTGTQICAYCAVTLYVNQRRVNSPYLFVHDNGQVLMKQTFVNATKAMISWLGLDSFSYTGHSYRVGSATTAKL